MKKSIFAVLSVVTMAVLVSCASTGSSASSLEGEAPFSGWKYGTVTDGNGVKIWENSVLNLGTTVPAENAVVANRKALSSMENSDTKADMMIVVNDASALTQSVSVADLGSSYLYIDDDQMTDNYMNNKAFIDAIEGNYISNLESQGLEVKNAGVTTVNFLDRNVKAFYFDFNVEDTELHSYIVVRKSGRFLVQLTIGGTSKQEILNTIKKYYKIEG